VKIEEEHLWGSDGNLLQKPLKKTRFGPQDTISARSNQLARKWVTKMRQNIKEKQKASLPKPPPPTKCPKSTRTGLTCKTTLEVCPRWVGPTGTHQQLSKCHSFGLIH
jgi:hypothetical protein